MLVEEVQVLVFGMNLWIMIRGREFIGIEAGGPAKVKHAAPLTYGSKIGILHSKVQYVNQNSDGQIEETEFISAGLDPGISPSLFFKRYKKSKIYCSER